MNKYGNVIFYGIFLILCLGFTECRFQKDIGHVNKEAVGLCKTPDGYPRHCDEKSNETTRNATEKEAEATRKTTEKSEAEATRKTTQKPIETTRNATEITRKPTTQKVETTKKVTTVEKESLAASTTEDPTDTLADLTRKDPSGKIGTTGSAALAAGICVAIALAGYTSLMVYRKMISKRYGNSEILLNEDDVADIQDEDMKHFEESSDVEILWRIARAEYKLSEETATSADEKRKLVFDAFEIITKSLALDRNSSANHKWMSVLLDARSTYDGIKARISNLPTVKEHMMKASELNPKDATVLHMLGLWCYQIADMPWYQRKIASTVFAAPPRSSYEEALVYFEKAEDIDPKFYG